MSKFEEAKYKLSFPECTKKGIYTESEIMHNYSKYYRPEKKMWVVIQRLKDFGFTVEKV